jgi:hypothetical protein
MIRIATACVHVLGLQEDRSGIEDLWMLTRLTELVPPNVEVCSQYLFHPIDDMIAISLLVSFVVERPRYP